RPFAAERRQHLRERMTVLDVNVAIGADDEQSCVAHLSSEELQQQERRLVGPVKVVEQEHRGLRLRRSDEEARYCVEQAKARRLAIERLNRRHLGNEVSYLGHDLGEQRRTGAQIVLDASTISPLDVGPQNLNPRPEYGGAFTFVTAPDENSRA